MVQELTRRSFAIYRLTELRSNFAPEVFGDDANLTVSVSGTTARESEEKIRTGFE